MGLFILCRVEVGVSEVKNLLPSKLKLKSSSCLEMRKFVNEEKNTADQQYLFHVYFICSFQACPFLHYRCFQTLTAVVFAINFVLCSFNGVSVIEHASIFFCFHFRCFAFAAPGDLELANKANVFLNPLLYFDKVSN